MQIRLTSSALSVALACAVAAAAPLTALAEQSPPGDIPDNQAFVIYRGAGYRIEVPEGWARTTRGRVVRFADKYNAIRVELRAAAAAPTVASAKREFPALRAAIPGFAAAGATPVTRPAGRGVLVRYLARSARSPVTGKSITNGAERYELWRAGGLAIITLEAPRGSDNVDAWLRVTSSFRWAR
jgi:hypothetical protein